MDNIMSSKLFTTRQGTVLLGVIAAIIAAIALIVYLNQLPEQRQAAAPPSQVLVGQQADPAGDVRRRPPHESQLLRDDEPFAKSDVETGAIVRPGDALGPGGAHGHLAGPAADGVRLRCRPEARSPHNLNPQSARGRRRARLAAGGRRPDRRRQPRRRLGLDHPLGHRTASAVRVAKLLFQNMYVLAAERRERHAQRDADAGGAAHLSRRRTPRSGSCCGRRSAPSRSRRSSAPRQVTGG